MASQFVNDILVLVNLDPSCRRIKINVVPYYLLVLCGNA